jgi:hypothetical protein
MHISDTSERISLQREKKYLSHEKTVLKSRGFLGKFFEEIPDYLWISSSTI